MWITRGYNVLNAQITEQNALGTLTTTVYGPTGLRTNRIDGNGQTTSYVYDAVSRETQVRYHDGSRVTISYDALGRVATQAYSLGVVTNTYNALGQLTGVAFAQAANRFRHTFDAAGNRASMVIGTGGVFSYSYDALNALSGIHNPYNERTTLAYDALGRERQRVLGNGVKITFAFDAAGRNTLLDARTSAGVGLAIYSASYDPVGNRLAVQELDGTLVTYAYDAAYQLTKDQRSGANAYNNSFTFDPAGNRLTRSASGSLANYTSNAADQLTLVQPASGSPTTLSYDLNGNVTLEKAGTVVDSYTWDPENRLSVWNSGTYSQLQTFAYDPSGLRVRRVLPTRMDNMLNDDQNPSAGSGQAQPQVVTGDPVVCQHLPGVWGSLFSVRYLGASKVVVPDFQGHSRLMVNRSEVVRCKPIARSPRTWVMDKR